MRLDFSSKVFLLNLKSVFEKLWEQFAREGFSSCCKLGPVSQHAVLVKHGAEGQERGPVSKIQAADVSRQKCILRFLHFQDFWGSYRSLVSWALSSDLAEISFAIPVRCNICSQTFCHHTGQHALLCKCKQQFHDKNYDSWAVSLLVRVWIAYVHSRQLFKVQMCVAC